MIILEFKYCCLDLICIKFINWVLKINNVGIVIGGILILVGLNSIIAVIWKGIFGFLVVVIIF